MGCRVSKVDDLPLVIKCRERKRLIKCAVDYRYELSCAHLDYFHSLKEVGFVLSKFVDEQLVIASPVLTLPSDSVSRVRSVDRRNQDKESESESESESELSVSLDGHIHIHDDENDDDHDDDSGGFENKPPQSSNFNRPGDYNEMNMNEPYGVDRGQQPYQPQWGEPYVENSSAFPFPYPYQPPWGPNETSWGAGEPYQPPYVMNPSASQYPPPWGAYQANFDTFDGYGGNSNLNSNPNPNRYAFFMKKSAPASHTVIQQEEARGFRETRQRVDHPPGYDPYVSGYGYGYGFSYGGEPPPPQEPEKPKSPPPPPPPPMESDYFNFFNAYDNEYHGYGYGYNETMDSSPDASEVRAREGIPDLEEETETDSHYEDVKTNTFSRKRNLVEGKEDGEDSTLKGVSSSTEGSSRRIKTPPEKSDDTANAAQAESSSNSVPLEVKREHSVGTEVEKQHSSETIVSQSTEEGNKGVSVDIDEGSTQELEIESSIMSSLTTLSPHGSRDLHEVVNEIKGEFESAFSHGKEVALMLEAGKLPYRSKFAVLKVILSKFAPSLVSPDRPIQSARSSSRVTKLAGSYDDAVLDVRPVNLSSTLEKLYVWEKKLYKEVKGEERLRVIYEKTCKRLNELDAKGAESSKIDAAQASIKRLTTKLNVSIKAIDVISCEIDKVRDRELQPQVSQLIYGLIRMWRLIVKCHRRQFEAIMESRSRTLRANTSLERDSSLRTTLELETGLLKWAQHFNNWINAQKSYANSLNGWLKQCIDHEPEVTVDGEVPYSPGRLGAPPIFIICNDWQREINGVSQEKVLKAMHSFAFKLRKLVERQDDIQRLMVKKEHLAKDFVGKSQSLRPDETHGSMVPSEERASVDYKEAMKLVQDGELSSLQGGVIPIFKALEVFTRDALKAYEQVRLA
ncbi:hypothetical protein HanHA89_Chr11g0409881 [Helianthus annuus]|nr:hypothetical protein HanHA89_Chr11g0409881 [Helianthus annuus]